MPASKTIAPVARSSVRGFRHGHNCRNDDLLRINEVCQRTGLSVSTVYQLILLGHFPCPIALGVRAKAWPAYVIDAWLASRIAARDAMVGLHDVVVLPAWMPEMEQGQTETGIQVMRLAGVVRRVGLRKSQIYRMIGEGSFPAPVPIGVRARAWVRSEVDAWVRQRIEARRKDPRFRFLTNRLPGA